MTKLLLVFLLSTLSACASSTGEPNDNTVGLAADGAVGSMSIPLVAEADSGARYRLSDAVFVVAGEDPGDVWLISTEEDPNAESLELELVPGAYSILLSPDWTLSRGLLPVDAELVSDNPVDFEISRDEMTDVVFTFEVEREIIDLGTGILSVSIDVTET